MSRTPLIAGNWKMNKTPDEAIKSAQELVELTAEAEAVEAMIAPPFTALAAVATVLADSPIHLGAQNLFWEASGAYTGEIAPNMLTAVGCSHVIIGHSERRQYFNETDATVNKRVHAAVGNGLIPVVCIGETLEERQSESTQLVLGDQLKAGLANLTAKELADLVVAYEPIWAIGTGQAATPDMAQATHQFIRGFLQKSFGNKLANSVKILYGGSVNVDNIKELMAKPDIDGALVGGASLEAETFSQLVCFNLSENE